MSGGGFTPREIVAELDKYIVGQEKAKRAVAIALRNRWRRQQVPGDLRDEITPKNIIMIGPTGVGKTEIARRLAKLAQAPFLKVEATKYTEVGYVGKDVESMIRDLMEIGVNLVRAEHMEKVKVRAAENAEERILDLLIPPPRSTSNVSLRERIYPEQVEDRPLSEGEYKDSRERMRRMLKDGMLDDRIVELETREKQMPTLEIFGMGNLDEMGMHLQDMFGSILPKKRRRRRMKVKDALEVLTAEESERLVDEEQVRIQARERVEQSGIIFIDEIDKVAGSFKGGSGPDVSREGVQRDILPLVEGCRVQTKYGMVSTEHILFIAAGAFNVSKPSDLIPELQGRFPIRVELEPLTASDFVKILKEPKNSLVKQYAALLETEQVRLSYTDSGIAKIAEIAAEINNKTENIGARRLHTVMEALLESISFDAPDMAGAEVMIDDKYVEEKLSDIARDEDLSRYIL